MRNLGKIENNIASAVFPKLIKDGKNFILLTLDSNDDDSFVNIQIRCGGHLMVDDDNELSFEKVAYYLKTAFTDIDQEIQEGDNNDEWPND